MEAIYKFIKTVQGCLKVKKDVRDEKYAFQLNKDY